MKTELKAVTLLNYQFKNYTYNMTSTSLAKANWTTTTPGVYRAQTSSWKPAIREDNCLVLPSGCQFYFKTNYRLPLYESAYANYVPTELNFTFQPKATNSVIIEFLTYDPFNKAKTTYDTKLRIGLRSGANGTIAGAYIYRFNAAGKADQIIAEIPTYIGSSEPIPRNMGTIADTYTLNVIHKGNKIIQAYIKNNVTGQAHMFSITGPVAFNAEYLAFRITATVSRIYSLNDTPLKSYTVTFNSNGGSSVPSRTVKEGQKVGDLPIPTKTNYAFNGWYTTLSGGTKITKDTIVTGNVTYYAHWTSTAYTVSFNTFGGTTIAPQTVQRGQTATRPIDPTRTGYQFVRWYVGDSSIQTTYTFTEPVYNNTVVNAEWREITATYTVVFDSNGGTNIPNQVVAKGSKAYCPYPTRTGYNFVGWFYRDSSESVQFNFNTPIYANTYLIAHWTPITYQVMFNSAGGTTIPNQTVAYGGKAIQPTNPTRSGYDFNGWYVTESSEEVQYNFNAPVYSNKYLTAHWSQKTSITVTFNSNGGSAVAAQQVAYGGKVTKPADPTKSGYEFVNWLAGDGSSSYVYNFNSPVYYPFTLTAQWKVPTVKYTVTFDSMGGSSVSSQQVAAGSKATQPANPTKSGYKFNCWRYKVTDSSTGEAIYYPYNFNSAVVSNLTLYAYWTVDTTTYTVTFNSTGGSAVASQQVTAGQYATKPSNPYRTGYTFTNWYYNAGSSEYVVFDFANTKITSNITLFAEWEMKTFSVAFNSTGGSAVATQSIPYGGYAVKPTDPTKSGYIFNAWMYGDASTETVFDFNSQRIYWNTTLRASWLPDTTQFYTVTYVDRGTTLSTQRVVQNTTIKSSDAPTVTRAGYTFLGWYVEDSSYSYKWNYANIVTGNMTLVAHWQVNANVILALDSNGISSAWSKTSGSVTIKDDNITIKVDGYDWSYDGQYIEIPVGSTIQLTSGSRQVTIKNPSGTTIAVLQASAGNSEWTFSKINYNTTTSGTVTISGNGFLNAVYA